MSSFILMALLSVFRLKDISEVNHFCQMTFVIITAFI